MNGRNKSRSFATINLVTINHIGVAYCREFSEWYSANEPSLTALNDAVSCEHTSNAVRLEMMLLTLRLLSF